MGNSDDIVRQRERARTPRVSRGRASPWKPWMPAAICLLSAVVALLGNCNAAPSAPVGSSCAALDCVSCVLSSEECGWSGTTCGALDQFALRGGIGSSGTTAQATALCALPCQTETQRSTLQTSTCCSSAGRDQYGGCQKSKLGDPCALDTDCDSDQGTCQSGKCACIPVNASCNDFGPCCGSASCQDTGDAGRVCSTQCLPALRGCSTDAQCCSGSCVAASCVSRVSPDGGSTQPDASVDGPSCIATNDSCTVQGAVPCCAGACACPNGQNACNGADATCQPVPLGGGCTANDQCTSGECGLNQGTGKMTFGVCVSPAGAACTRGSECGSGLCYANPPGTSTCSCAQAWNAFSSNSDACQVDSDCCQTPEPTVCKDGVCIATCACSSTCPDGTCTSAVEFCATGTCCESKCPECGSGGQSNGCGQTCAAAACPSGYSCTSGTCKPSGPCVPSCTGRQCGSDGCGGSCGTCATGFTCNTPYGQCLNNSTLCSPDGVACSQPSQCCNGWCSANACSSCSTGTSDVCLAAGSSTCAQTADCCQGLYCNPTNHTCLGCGT